MYEHFFQCPYCWEEISMLLDNTVRRQKYIEDCEVCCNPIEVEAVFEHGELSSFEARNLEQ
ncbi:CPXCG motif-containing cysteine-rich protein [Salinimicrobium sp. HB62]|uniref:CPXCG motif-containing cysteine-rich protein n=1 Tax=Salinimicrobium sp. HB62 TaxID=3077781 RepID=UPI002D77D459|nr:CPXCG motif-containing cysteine-rich protein [Salinimicrobium sp. HB62]